MFETFERPFSLKVINYQNAQHSNLINPKAIYVHIFSQVIPLQSFRINLGISCKIAQKDIFDHC